MKLAIVGAGMIVHDFLTMSRELPELELVTIVGLPNDLDRMTDLQKQYPIGRVSTDYDQVLQEKDIDTIYLGIPNSLHFDYAKKALQAGKNVVVEKPFTLNWAQANELKELALTKDLILVEAITGQYSKAYLKLKQHLDQVGSVKVVFANSSHYSSRYDAFKAGKILPAFDPAMGGGALLDQNIYSIHFVVGLFGKPEKVHYQANVSHAIDTSGVLVLEYPGFKAVCLGAKDSGIFQPAIIQADGGNVEIEGPLNIVSGYNETLYSGEIKKVSFVDSHHRMYNEFKKFNQIVQEHDMSFVREKLTHSLDVMSVVDAAFKDAGIHIG